MRRALVAVGLVALAGACGEPGRTVEEQRTELLFRPELLSIDEEPAPGAVRVGHVRPGRRGPLEGLPPEAPALLMPPTSRVSFTVPARVELDTAFGVDVRSARTAFADLPATERLLLDWGVAVDGELVVEGTVHLGRAATRPGGWQELLPDGGRLVLEAGATVTLLTDSPDADTWASLGDDAPRVGFRHLRLVEEREVPVTAASPEAPNVVLVLMDTLRGDRTGVGGHDRPTTPRLDALAARGTAFTQALATSSWTWPSTASLLTGYLPEEHGVEAPVGSYLFGELDTLAERWRRGGARTAAFIGNQLISESHNFHQGFDAFREPGRPEFVDAEVLVPEALAWLDDHVARHGDQRFFLYLHPTDPHRPYDPHPDSVAALPVEKPEGYRHVPVGEHFRDLWLEANDVPADAPRPLLAELVPPEDKAWIDGSYDQAVHTGDLWLGRLLDHLAALGLEDDTLVVFTSDHGEEFFEHGLLMHGQSLYPELVEVPLVVAGPGVPAGRVVDEPVANRRVHGFLAAAAEGQVEPSLLEEGAGLAFTSTRRGIWNGATSRSLHAVRRGRWSLHLAPDSAPWGAPVDAPPPEGGTLRLYDLEADPTEHRDVSAAHPDVVAELKDVLLRRLATSARLRTELGVDGHDALGGLEAGDATLELLKDIGYL